MKKKMRTPAGTDLHGGFQPPEGQVRCCRRGKADRVPLVHQSRRALMPVPRHPTGCAGLTGGLRFHFLCLSGAASLSCPPLPPAGTCFSFSQPGVSGVGGERVAGGEEGEEVAAVASLEPCV